jgi:uncharacterized membrane protein YhaH (DUF805 family)
MNIKSTDDDVKVVSPPSFLSFTSLSGRYGRLNFADALTAIYSVPFVITVASRLFPALFKNSTVIITTIVVLMFCFFGMLTRVFALRLHDLNKSAILAFLVMGTVLILGFFSISSAWVLIPFTAILLMVPGNKDRNDYGIPSKKGSNYSLPILFAMIIGNELIKRSL